MSDANHRGPEVVDGVVGLVLAGGQSRRLPGGPKALQDLGGQPMVQRVMARLAPQVGVLALAVGAGHDGLQKLHARCLYDAVPSFRGPLAGLQAGLQALDRQPDAMNWLQLAPCDAPFLPTDLVERLQRAATEATRVLVPRVDGHLQPTFAAWRRDTRGVVDETLAERGGLGLLDVLRRLPFEAVDWPGDETPPPFFNVNDGADLAQARAWLEDPA